jgi:hypothetical protein
MSESRNTPSDAAPETRLEAPEALLERMYIEAYLQSKELTVQSVQDLPNAKQLMAEASAYASVKLTEVHMRARFMSEIHGTSPGLL